MAPTAHAFVLLADTQDGGRYLYGGKAAASDPNPKADGHPLDCSGLVTWDCRHLGLEMVDGAQGIYDFCKAHGTTIPIAEAEKTEGALGFLIEGNSIGHVVIFRGDGTTIEAKGRAYGIGHWADSEARWSYAAKIPGLDYSSHHPLPKPGHYPTLHYGDHGAAVGDLQHALNHAGVKPTLAIDDDYGPKTAEAVELYKKAHPKLIDNHDGRIAGSQIWKALER